MNAPDQTVQYLNVLVYGEPGSGKTYFAATAQDHEETRPVLFLDVEGGVMTIRRRADIDVVPIRSMKEVEKAFNTLYMDTSGYYKTVVIDSLSELQSLDIRLIMKEAYDQRPDKVDPDVPDQRGWGKSREHIRTIVRAFRDLPCNTIFTAHVHSEKDEGEPTRFFPSFPGKLRSDVPGFMDIVGYLTAESKSDQTIRRMQFAKTKRVVAKDRTSDLGDVIESPSIPLLWEKLNS